MARKREVIAHGWKRYAKTDHQRKQRGPKGQPELEDALKGKVISESVAETAAAALAKGTVPLTDNKYKVQIAKTLVKRAILD